MLSVQSVMRTRLLSLPLGFVLLAFPLVGKAATPATPISARVGLTGIHPWLQVGERVSAEVLVDGKAVTQFTYQAVSPGMKRQASASFTSPTHARQLELRGTLFDPQGKPQTFRRTWALRDVASYSAPLYDLSLPWIKRIQVFSQHADAGVRVSPEPAATAAAGLAALRKLEQRLKLKLPAPVLELARYRIEINDSSFLAASDIRTVTELLLKDWGYSEKGEHPLSRILSPAARARYDRSIAVFVEVGDGLGALAWDPAGVVADEPGLSYGDKRGALPGTPNTGVWFWLHQDTLSEWNLLLDRAQQPRSAEDALTNAVQRFAMGDIVTPAHDNELVIDSAHPNALLQFHFDRDKKPVPRLWLRSYDYHYSLY